MTFEAFWQFMQVMIIPIFAWLVYEIRETRKSIVDLNTCVAVAIQRISHIETDHGRRITNLEDKWEQE